MDFIEDIVGIMMDSCNDAGIKLFCLCLFLMVLAEQSIGIYIAVEGLDGEPTLSLAVIITHSVIILFMCCCSGFCFFR